MPTVTTVMNWLLKNETFLEQYRASREIQADGYFDEQVDIADEATPETANVARLRIDARKWVMGRINAKKYGEKQSEINTSVNVHNYLIAPDKLKSIRDRHAKALEARTRL